MNKTKKTVWAAGSFLLILISIIFRRSCQSALLFNLVIWATAAEGAIALVAAAELCGAKWILPFKEKLLSVYPVPGTLAVLFLFINPFNIYPWAYKGYTWLNPFFFVIRNAVLLFVVFLSAKKYAGVCIESRGEKNKYAVIYLLIFVVSQSFVAFDWVMPLEYPWFSTLFGGYFFIEAVYAGIAITGILSYFRSRKNEGVYKRFIVDISTLLFGFSILWAGLFYSQFLVIWYGNLPEEVIFITKRIIHSPLREMSYGFIAALFFIPFIVLLSRKAKVNASVLFVVSAVVLLGVIIERFVFLAPVLKFNYLLLIVDFIIFYYMFITLLRKKTGM